MTLEDLQAKRRNIKKRGDIIFSNMQKIIDKDNNAVEVAHNSKAILDDLDHEFELQTGLQGNDIGFLFTAVGLQIARIAIINELTKIENAGSGNRNETKLHDFQEKVLRQFSDSDNEKERPYYASMEHIITKMGVPYDATSQLNEQAIQKMMGKNRSWDFDLSVLIPNEKISLFKGANHRFATLGHDPILGLLFGTANIMTNTITCVENSLIGDKIAVPTWKTNHVIYTSDYKDPHIGSYASTLIMFKQMIERTKEQPSALVASLIKQIIHIGTDLYTPCGIQIPAANLILSKKAVEKITSYVSTGDIVKIGSSAKLAELINLLIGTIHTLMYDTSMSCSRDVYNVRTRKIITYSNIIATGSNVLWTGTLMAAGKENAIRQLDIGGLLIILNRLKNDREYIESIKEEFIFGGFREMLHGGELPIEEIEWN